MEENKEKKKYQKRRHYRGKSRDRREEQDSAELQEFAERRPERSERRDKGEKKDRRDKQEKRDRQDRQEKQDKQERQGRRNRPEGKKPPEKKENRELDELEVPAEKPKHEANEIIFEFTWADAWGLYKTGYHVVIKDNPDKMYLSWSVDLKYDEVKIDRTLQEFLDDMKKCGIASWDGHRYTKQGIFDGDTWSLKVNSLRLKCEAQGTNEYPAEWKAFLKCLHEKWKIPVSKREQWE